MTLGGVEKWIEDGEMEGWWMGDGGVMDGGRVEAWWMEVRWVVKWTEDRQMEG